MWPPPLHLHFHLMWSQWRLFDLGDQVPPFKHTLWEGRKWDWNADGHLCSNQKGFTFCSHHPLAEFPFHGKDKWGGWGRDMDSRAVATIYTHCTLKVTALACPCPSHWLPHQAQITNSPGCPADLLWVLSACLMWHLAGLNQKSDHIRFALACVEVVVSHADMVAIKSVATGSYPGVQLCFVPYRLARLHEFPHGFLSCRPWLFHV